MPWFLHTNMSESTLHIPPEWRASAEEIAVQGGPVMVIGAPGSGKTTYCLYLAGYFCRQGRRVAWIDADPGQPFIGPPAAYSLGLYADAGELLKRKAPLIMGFIGNTSPVGHLLDAVTAVQKLYNRALSLGPDLVIINTSGLVNGGAARELKYHEIDMIAPRYVIAIELKNDGNRRGAMTLTVTHSTPREVTAVVCAPVQTGPMPAGTFQHRLVGTISLAVAPQHGGTVSNVRASVTSPVALGSFAVEETSVYFSGSSSPSNCPARRCPTGSKCCEPVPGGAGCIGKCVKPPQVCP